MFRIAVVFVVTALVLMLAFGAAEQYADRSAIPRYCADQQNVLGRVKIILTKKQPVGDGSKRPFIIAAKLIFLVPQKDNETVQSYVERLQRHLDKVCRGR
jgi:hypothetical protein